MRHTQSNLGYVKFNPF